MKKLCEIFDISKEYDMPDNSMLILVSDIPQNIFFSCLPELKAYSDKIMSTEDWYEFIEIRDSYRRNENKFYMREVRQSQKAEIAFSLYCQSDDPSDLFDNDNVKDAVAYALSFLKEQPKRRFIMHYSEHLTYRQIATRENKQISTIYESIKAAKKIFLNKLAEYPEQNTPNKCK